MSLVVVSYATQSHRGFQDRLHIQLASMGITSLRYWEHWLHGQSEYTAHRDIFDAPRGGGYWAWKPLVILDALAKYPDATILYLDSSTILRENPTALVMTNPFVTVRTSFENSAWTKRDCFVKMDCDTTQYWNVRQIWAGVVAVDRSYIDVVMEWRNFCLDYHIISDAPNTCGLPNFPNFMDHRHDQSIFSNLVAKYNLPTIETQLFIDT